jgi:hypothetical protein
VIGIGTNGKVVVGGVIRVYALEARRGCDGGQVVRQVLWIRWIEWYGGNRANVGRGGTERRGRVGVEDATEGHVWTRKRKEGQKRDLTL